MRTVYFENRSIVFCAPEELPKGIGSGEAVEAEGLEIIRAICGSFASGPSLQRLFIVNRDADTAFGQFCSCLNEIDAGGGVVRNGQGQYLMIFRRNLWDLPKGKREAGEEIESCALREVEEETGLHSLEIVRPICVTHHTCTFDGIFSIKHTYWYEMLHTGNEKPVPQLEEEITGVQWMSRQELSEKAGTSFRSIGEVIANL